MTLRGCVLAVTVVFYAGTASHSAEPAHCYNDQNSAFSMFDYLTYGLQFKVACGLDASAEARWFTDHALSEGCSKESEAYQGLARMVDEIVKFMPEYWEAADLPQEAKDRICALAGNYSPQTNSAARNEATRRRDWEVWVEIYKLIEPLQNPQEQH